MTSHSTAPGMTSLRIFTLRRATLSFLVHLVLLLPGQGSILRGCLALAHYALRELPHGFPWLMEDDRQAADLGNNFGRQSIRAASCQTQAGKFFLFARPEHLGRVRAPAPKLEPEAASTPPDSAMWPCGQPNSHGLAVVVVHHGLGSGLVDFWMSRGSCGSLGFLCSARSMIPIRRGCRRAGLQHSHARVA